jgi:uncharacterized lipoprotein YajG
MKKVNFKLFILSVFFAAFSLASCKSKSKENTTAPTTTTVETPAETSAPVVIAGNDELRKGVMDATKDYPDVKADVTDSVINLSGSINRADWQKLNPVLNTLHPKRINSTNLTIK